MEEDRTIVAMPAIIGRLTSRRALFRGGAVIACAAVALRFDASSAGAGTDDSVDADEGDTYDSGSGDTYSGGDSYGNGSIDCGVEPGDPGDSEDGSTEPGEGGSVEPGDPGDPVAPEPASDDDQVNDEPGGDDPTGDGGDGDVTQCDYMYDKMPSRGDEETQRGVSGTHERKRRDRRDRKRRHGRNRRRNPILGR